MLVRSPRLARQPHLAVPGEQAREAGGEQAGVDGPGDGRVEADGGHDRRADGALDVGGAQRPPGLGDEHDAVGSAGDGDGAPQGEVAGAGDEQAADVVAEQLVGRRVAAGVDDRGRAGGQPAAELGPPRRLAVERRRAARDQPGRAVDVDGQVVERARRGVGRQPVGDALAGRLGQPEDGGQLAVEVDEQESVGQARAMRRGDDGGAAAALGGPADGDGHGRPPGEGPASGAEAIPGDVGGGRP